MERTIDKTVWVGTTVEAGSLYCRIQFRNGKLSITGVEGPMPSGNCRGSCGQIVMHEWDIKNYAAGWDAAMVSRFRDAWNSWHMNSMRAGCEHQRATWNPSEELATTNGRTELAGWVYPSEHPKGLLTKPCDVCGYRYGTSWLHEDVPSDVLDFLESLPDADRSPAWV